MSPRFVLLFENKSCPEINVSALFYRTGNLLRIESIIVGLGFFFFGFFYILDFLKQQVL